MFSMLRALLLRLNGLPDERWVQSTQYFRMVRIGSNAPWLPWLYKCGIPVVRLQALEDGQFELCTAFLVVQETIAHWPQIVAYISSTSQRQEFQHVEGSVGIVVMWLSASNNVFNCFVF